MTHYKNNWLFDNLETPAADTRAIDLLDQIQRTEAIGCEATAKS